MRFSLTQGKVAEVDEGDLKRLAAHKWYAAFNGTHWYARTAINRTKVYMHRFLMNPGDGYQVDHIDGNTLNNCRNNLRVCTNHQNRMNQKKRPGRSKYKGVIWFKQTGKWQACITLNKKKRHLGYFFCEKEAARVYNKQAKKLFGRFARLNEVEDE